MIISGGVDVGCIRYQYDDYFGGGWMWDVYGTQKYDDYFGGVDVGRIRYQYDDYFRGVDVGRVRYPEV